MFFYPGSHTGGRIRAKYEDVITQYQLTGKVSHIVTDNASNMKSPFAVQFPATVDEQESLEDSGSEDIDQWLDGGDLSVDDIEVQRLSCFAHILFSYQLATG